MKPTTKQLDFLNMYLCKNLRYRETYTEFYDHILSALETKPDNMPFQDAVDSIVTADFGSYQGMNAIETRYQKIIMGEMKRRYIIYIADCLKFPLVVLTATLAVLFYWITQQAWFNFPTFLLLLFATRIIPGLLKGARYLWLGYSFKSIKRSVKDGALKWLDFIPVTLYLIAFIVPALTTPSPAYWFKSASPITLTLCMLVCAIHTITCFKVYKDEFKTIITR